MITVNELFSGIGAQSKGLKRLGIEFEVVGIAEIDKYAIKSYEEIHGKVKNYGDICKVEKLDYADFWTYSFPCQDISVAGRLKGIVYVCNNCGKEFEVDFKNETCIKCEECGSSNITTSRSGLLKQVERLLEESKKCGELPKYLMLENVKNLVSKKFKHKFEEWIDKLDQLGYNTYWKVLNAKDYGIPQNRERVFAISIRKDIDKGFSFPEPFELTTRIKDILEEEVEEKYYIKNEKSKKLIAQLKESEQITNQITTCDGSINTPKAKDVSNCITARYDCGISNQKSMGTMVVEKKIKQIGNIVDTGNWGNPQRGRIYSVDGVSPALNTCGGGGLEPKVVVDKTVCEQRCDEGKGPDKIRIKQATKKGYVECVAGGIADFNYPTSRTRRGRVLDDGNICPTITSEANELCRVENQYRIRKLTPLECWRLMGFDDDDFYKAEKVNSNAQLYKQAGNSIVVDVLYHIFKNLFY